MAVCRLQREHIDTESSHSNLLSEDGDRERDLDGALGAALGRSGDLDAALLCFFSFFRFFFFSRRSFLPSAHTLVSD